jgi:prepilin-type N-terminal cleavage/methylation domain-containing protein
MKSIRINKSGFTLVEVALALLVISVGLLAVFSLFPAGMALNKQAIDDTYGAMFAEEVFAGLRAHAAREWSTIQEVKLPPRSIQKWGYAAQMIVEANAGWQTARYTPAALGGDALDFAVRYNLIVQPHPENPDNRAYAILEILTGEFGPTNNPLRIYTEFINTSSQ